MKRLSDFQKETKKLDKTLMRSIQGGTAAARKTTYYKPTQNTSGCDISEGGTNAVGDDWHYMTCGYKVPSLSY